MARGHGRILTLIWEDADFLMLSQEQQRLYLFLISQPNLNHAGLLPLTLRRWASKAHGLTSAALRADLGLLEEARFIVVDEETEELLIRSFVRSDGVWKMPKVMGAMVSGAMEISSHKLRRALLAEMDRIPLDELSDEPGTKFPSIRYQVAEHIETLRKAIAVPEPTPPSTPSKRVEEPHGNPIGSPSGTPSDTPAEGFAEGSDTQSEGSTCGRAATSRAHSPAPAPAPTPTPEKTTTASEPFEQTLTLELVQVAETAPPPGASKRTRKKADPKPNPHQVADDLAAAFWERYKTSTAQGFIAVRTVLRTALRNGLDRDNVARAIDNLGREGRALSGGAINTALMQVRGPHLRAVAGGYQGPFQQPTPADRANDQGF